MSIILQTFWQDLSCDAIDFARAMHGWAFKGIRGQISTKIENDLEQREKFSQVFRVGLDNQCGQRCGESMKFIHELLMTPSSLLRLPLREASLKKNYGQKLANRVGGLADFITPIHKFLGSFTHIF